MIDSRGPADDGGPPQPEEGDGGEVRGVAEDGLPGERHPAVDDRVGDEDRAAVDRSDSSSVHRGTATTVEGSVTPTEAKTPVRHQPVRHTAGVFSGRERGRRPEWYDTGGAP